MPFLRPVNLPAPLIAQSVACVGLGLWLVFMRRPPVAYGSGASKQKQPSGDQPLKSSSAETYSMLVPSSPSPRMADTISLLGIAITGLEITYLVTSYMPFEENQFIAASVPVRIFLASLMATICAINRKSVSRSGLWEFVGLATMDGLAGLWLGRKLGRWDGMVKGA